jgi:hypothetical protein
MTTMSVDATVPKKLGLKPGMRVLLVNAPEGYREALASVEPGLALQEVGGESSDPVGAIHLFAANRAELEAAAPASLAAWRSGARLWVSYPKGGSSVTTDLNRDVDWGPLAAAGFRPVTQVSIDPVWSALRFRPLDEVGR